MSGHNSIKFTHHISKDCVPFLDLEIYKGDRFKESGILDVRPHFKDTNRFQYLQYSSAHPRSTFRGTVKGELTRILRASSNEESYTKAVKLLTTKFRARGYPRELLRQVTTQVPFTSRATTLEEKDTHKTDCVPLIASHSDQTPKSELVKALEPPPELQCPLLCFTKGRDLSSKLVRARLPGSNRPQQSLDTVNIGLHPTFCSHSTPCGTTGCLCCQLMSKKERVHADNKVFHTPPNTNCNSQGLVYLIECTNCLTRNCYVGQTGRTLKERMAGHRAAHAAKKNMPLYRHLDRHAQPRPLSSVRVTILEIVHPPSEASLLDREARWMCLLNSKIPHGLNSKF